MEEIRIHGRGGQGVVSAAELIALAAFYDGYETQAFPSFGVERNGAPIESFARIDHQAIITHEQIYKPSILIIQDSTLIDTVEIFKGIDKNTKIIINALKNRWSNPLLKAKWVYFLPATEIALKILGKNIVNTIILGALVKYTGVISLKSLKKAIRIKFANKGEKIIKKNLEAVSLINKN